MRMKSFKQKVIKEKEQPNIYMKKTQGPKVSMSSPILQQRFKSKTLLNKQNYQPNVNQHNRQKSLIQNSFGAAKLMMRQSVDDLKLYSNNLNEVSQSNQPLHFSKSNLPKSNFGSKSINFQNYRSQMGQNPFSKKRLKTQEVQIQNQNVYPLIQDCQLIRSEYESSSSSDSAKEEKLNYAKSFNRRIGCQNQQKIRNPIFIQQSLNYDDRNERQIISFGPGEVKNMQKYQDSREEQKKMRNQIFDNIFRSSKAQLMKSWDGGNQGHLKCINHPNRKAKYRLKNVNLGQKQEEPFYCSRCAVNLASQSFAVQELLQVQRKLNLSTTYQNKEIKQLNQSLQLRKQQIQKRQHQLTGFQNRLQVLKSKISSKLKLFSQKSEQMSKVNKKISLTKNNYDKLIDILKQMKNEEIMKQKQFQKQKTLDITHKKQELARIITNLQDTSYQINTQKYKLMALKNSEFSLIFQSYINKISSYEEYLTNLQQSQLAMQIDTFNENLASEQLDEDLIINDIFSQMYKRLTNPRLEALINSSKQLVPPESLKSQKQQNNEEVQSGGSSMFYCEQQQSRPPFRILFGDKSQQILRNERNNRNRGQPKGNFEANYNDCVNSSIKMVKEQNFQLNKVNHYN